MKRILFVVLVVVSIVCLLLSFYYLPKKDKDKIRVNYAPSIAILTIDGQNTGQGNKYLSRGSHKAVLKLDGFTSEVKYFNTNDTTELNMVVTPNSSEGMSIVNENEKYQTEIENIGGKIVLEGSNNQAAMYNFIQYLPLEGRNYKVGYGKPSAQNKKKDAIALYVSADTPQDRRNALEAIAGELGINPSAVEIFFDDYKINPFTEPEYE